MGTGKSVTTWTRSWTRLSIWPAAFLAFGLSACGAGNDQAVEALDVEEVVAYWSVKGKSGDNFVLNPVIRFRIRNNGGREVDYIQTMAGFRLDSSPDAAWGNAFEFSISGDPVPSGGLSRVVTLRCDATFYSKDQPRAMLENEHWEQVHAEIFLRVGSSGWRSITTVEVPKRLGAPGVEKFLEPQDEEPAAEEPPAKK
jgi:hypothetical protein